MPALSFKNPFTGKTSTLGNDQQAQSNPQSGIFSLNWGGAGNEHAISLLNANRDKDGLHTSLGSVSSGDKTAELLPQTQNGGKTTTSIGSYDDGDEKVSLLPTTLSSEGGTSIDVSLLEGQADSGESVRIGNANAGYVNKSDGDGGNLSGWHLGGEVMGVEGQGGSMSLGNVHADSLIHEKGGKSEMVLDGGASSLNATLNHGDHSDTIAGPGFGVSGHSSAEGIGLSGGPVIAQAESTHTSTDADGNTTSTTAGLDFSTQPGVEYAVGDVGLDGDEEYGLMLNGIGGGKDKDGDLGFMLHKADLDGNGTLEPSGLDLAYGGSAGVEVADTNANGQNELNVSGSAGPVSGSTSAESGGSLLDSVSGFVGDRVDDVKGIGSTIGGWLGLGR